MKSPYTDGFNVFSGSISRSYYGMDQSFHVMIGTNFFATVTAKNIKKTVDE